MGRAREACPDPCVCEELCDRRDWQDAETVAMLAATNNTNHLVRVIVRPRFFAGSGEMVCRNDY
jgi:hypothetical protein